MSRYVDIEGAPADTWTSLTDSKNRAWFEANFNSAIGEALAHVQNDGDNDMDVRVQNRPVDDTDSHNDPQEWSYDTQKVASDQEPARLRLERAEELEYRIQINPNGGSTDAAAWVVAVAGEAA